MRSPIDVKIAGISLRIRSGMSGNKSDSETAKVNFEEGQQFESIIIRQAELASYVDEKGLLKFAQSDFPRIDYNPNPNSRDVEGKHKCLGLLLEPSSTNRLLFSTNLMHPCWINAHLISKQVENDVISPEGTFGEGKVISILDLPGKDFHLIKQRISNPTLEDRTVSVFVKPVENGGSKDFAIWGFGGLQIAVFSRKDWSLISGTAIRTSIETYKNDWVRLSATYRATNNDIYFGTSQGSSSRYEGENQKQFYIYGPQLENLHHSTSYIPSQNISQKRNGDLLYLDSFCYNGELYDSEVNHLEYIQNIDFVNPPKNPAIAYYKISCFFSKNNSINQISISRKEIGEDLQKLTPNNHQRISSEEAEVGYELIWKKLNKLSNPNDLDWGSRLTFNREEIFNYFKNNSHYQVLDIDNLNREDKKKLAELGISLINLELIRQDDPELENFLISEFNSSEFELTNKVIRKTDFKWDSINKTLDYQQSIIEMGYIYSICPISHKIVRSNQSFFQHQTIYSKNDYIPVCIYRFIGCEVFYLMTGGWDGGKLCIYFPKFELIIKLSDRLWSPHITPDKYANLLNNLKANFVIHWPKVKLYIDDNKPKNLAAILGVYKNVGHYFWNELSGIQRLYDQEILHQVEKFLTGPNSYIEVENVFPEISSSQVMRVNDLNDYFKIIIDNDYCIVRVTDFYIREPLADRVKSAALSACDLSFLKEVDKLQKYFPLLWVNLRSHNKVWTNQVEGYAKIITTLSQDYPNLAVVFDGTPDAQPMADQIIGLIPSSVKTYNALNCKICETIVLAYAIDVYIAIVGSGLTFPTWLANKPGVAHGDHAHLSQQIFWSDIRENAVPPVFIPQEYIVQQQGRMYTNYDCDWKVIYDEVFKLLKNARKKNVSLNHLIFEKYKNDWEKWTFKLNKIRKTLKPGDF
ncbi:MAG: hypothetical protein KA714_21440 [Limnoraphis sp. WC205]|nr:hypothetical protein [Limnoraphis sp. WC205]